MKFIIQRDRLLKPLQLINGVVERRQTLPVLGNVLLSAEGQVLTLTGTDLEVELTGTAQLTDLIDAGAVTVPARKLFDIFRSLPEAAEVEIKLDSHKLFVSTGKSRFSLTTLPASDFPKVKNAQAGVPFELNANDLKAAINSTQFAMAQQDVRYYLNGSLWQLAGGQFTCVATDGHRLALTQASVFNDNATEAKVIVPRKAIAEIAKMLGEADAETVAITIGAHHIQLVKNETILNSKLIDGKFPEYQNVIPKNNQYSMVVDRDVLRSVLSRVAILSNEKFRGVRFTLSENTLSVMANNPEHEEAEESLDVNYQGAAVEIALNVTYVLEALNTLPKGNVVLHFGGSEKSVLIEHEDKSAASTLNVIMPMRL